MQFWYVCELVSSQAKSGPAEGNERNSSSNQAFNSETVPILSRLILPPVKGLVKVQDRVQRINVYRRYFYSFPDSIQKNTTDSVDDLQITMANVSVSNTSLANQSVPEDIIIANSSTRYSSFSLFTFLSFFKKVWFNIQSPYSSKIDEQATAGSQEERLWKKVQNGIAATRIRKVAS